MKHNVYIRDRARTHDPRISSQASYPIASHRWTIDLKDNVIKNMKFGQREEKVEGMSRRDEMVPCVPTVT